MNYGTEYLPSSVIYNTAGRLRYTEPMARQDSTWFKILPTTDRSAETLARRHGYETVAKLAASLPQHAKVLDVGAGASTLGHAVAQLRPDVHWVNLDFSYHDKQILRDVSRSTPPNLEFIAGDVTHLDEFIKPASMDAVFSYWLFPHLSLYDPQTALMAAEQIYKAAKPGSMLVVGPRRQPIFHPATLFSRSWQTRKDETLTAETYSREILRQSQLSAPNRKVRIALDTAADELFGTSRYVKDNKIYNPKTQKYIPRYDPRTICQIGKLLFITFVLLIRPQRIEDKGGS